MVGWFRRFRLPPPPLVLVRFRRPPFFFFLALSGFARGGLGVLVLVFLLVPPLLFCVPCLVFRLRNFHFIVISISSSFSFHPHFHFMVRALVESPPAAGRVCETSEQMYNFYSLDFYFHIVQRNHFRRFAGGHRRPIELCPTKLSMVSLGYLG